MTTEQMSAQFWKRYLSRGKIKAAAKVGIRLGSGSPRASIGEGEDPPPTPPPAPPAPPPGKTFTQGEVDKLMENHRKGLQEKYKTVETQLNSMLEKTNLTETERNNLQQQLEEVQRETKTKEELHKTEVQKLQEKSTKEVAALKSQAETWQQRYVTSTVGNALMSAAVKAKAFNPDQILTMFGPVSRIQEEIGEDQKPTGRFGVKVKINILKDGKPTELDLVPDEALKILAEQPEYANLFVDRSTPGLGGNNGNGTSRLPTLSPDTSMDDYRKNRDKYLAAKG